MKHTFYLYLYFVGGPLLFLAAIVFFVGVKVKAEISMCKIYYSEMTTWDCYWADKVLPQRGNK